MIEVRISSGTYWVMLHSIKYLKEYLKHGGRSTGQTILMFQDGNEWMVLETIAVMRSRIREAIREGARA